MYLPFGWFASTARMVRIFRLGGLHLPWKTFPWCSSHYKSLHGSKIEAALLLWLKLALVDLNSVPKWHSEQVNRTEKEADQNSLKTVYTCCMAPGNTQVHQRKSEEVNFQFRDHSGNAWTLWQFTKSWSSTCFNRKCQLLKPKCTDERLY